MARKRNPILWDFGLLKKLYEEEGLTVQQIGDRLGVSGKVANKACRRAGCKMRRRGPKNGPEHTGWKGGLTIDKSGYILRHCPSHPNCNKSGYIRDHRLVMERKLGRYLGPKEVVHHIDGDPANNHPDNLEVFESNGKHLAETLKGKCPQWTPDGKAKILAGVQKAQKSNRRPRPSPDAQAS
jgi:hypothetical protein